MATETQPVSAADIERIQLYVREYCEAFPSDNRVPMLVGHCRTLLRAIDELQAKCALTAAASLLVEAQHLEQLAAELRRRVDEAARGEEAADDALDLSAKCERLEHELLEALNQRNDEGRIRQRAEEANGVLREALQTIMDTPMQVSVCILEYANKALVAADGKERPINERIEFALKESSRWNGTAARLLLERQAEAEAKSNG